MLWILLGMVLFVVAMIVIAVRRGLELRRLVEGGVATRGTIEKKWKHNSSTGRSVRRLRYSFVANDGQTHSRSIIAGEAEFAALAEGSAVTVVYLPGNPRINALETMVEQARQALAGRSAGPGR